MKNIFIFLFLWATVNVIAQEKYSTKSGTINFEASVPSFEEIEAKNTAVTAIFNASTGAFAALALIKGFRFKNALMEEHFNENYMESDIYPKATFKGTCIDFNKNNIQNTYRIKGILTLHGTSKEIEVLGSFNQEEDTIAISSSFKTKAEDFDIKIPSIVRNKIGKDIFISLNFNLKHR